MAEVSSYTPTYDYSNIGSVGGEAAQSVNGDMINKIRAAEEKSVIDPIIKKIDNIEPETAKLDEIKTAVTQFQDMASYFDLFNEENVFNQYNFDTSGTSAAFDTVSMSELKEGNITVDVTQIGQKDVYQSGKLEGIKLDDEISFGQGNSDKLSITVGSNSAYEFKMYNEDTDGNKTAKTYQELVSDINLKDDLQASLEAIGTDSNDDEIYRLIIKSTESGENNKLDITQNGLDDLGFYNTRSPQIDQNVYEDVGLNDGDVIVDGTNIYSYSNTDDSNSDGKVTLEELVSSIDNLGNYNAEFVDGRIKITNSDGSEVKSVDISTGDGSIPLFDSSSVGDISQYSLPIDASDSSMAFDDLNNILKAQNMQATIDGVEYDVSSNSITTQGSLKITGLELGQSTITIAKDTSAVSVAAEALVTNYNTLQTMLNDEIYSTDPVIEDKDMLRGILSDVKGMFFQNYGAKDPEYGNETDEYGDQAKAYSNVTNNTISIFSLGFSLDKNGDLSVDTDAFNEIVNRTTPEYTTDSDGNSVKKMDFDDLKNVFTGQYTNKGLGVQLKEYLDGLDNYKGTFYNYDIDLIAKKDDLEKDKKDELERLDAKYGIMAEQFSSYSAIIGQMESSFSGLKMMIEQSTKSS